MVICRIDKAVVFKAFLENDVDLIEGFLDKIDLTGRLLQERYGRFTKRCLTHYLDCAYLAALRGDISAEIVDLMIKRVSQCVDLPAFAQFVLAKNRINPGIFADYDELPEAVRTAILNSLPATANICAEIEKMEPGQLLTLLVLISKEMSGKAIDNSFHYPVISIVRSTGLLADDQLMAAMGLNLKRSKEGVYEDQLAELMGSY